MKTKALVSSDPKVEPVTTGVSLGTLQAASPRALVEGAASIAGVLAEVIRTQKLAVAIQGKQYVRVEGWTTLAVMLGVVAREVSTVEEFGVYIATIELVRMTDGVVISRASAECGEEKPWCDRPRFARRSMSQTRATGKACRLAFSWIMALAGYEVCPAEEMEAALVPQNERAGGEHSLGNAVITPEQTSELRRLIIETGSSESRFCAYLKISNLSGLPSARFEAALAALQRKEKKTSTMDSMIEEFQKEMGALSDPV